MVKLSLFGKIFLCLIILIYAGVLTVQGEQVNGEMLGDDAVQISQWNPVSVFDPAYSTTAEQVVVFGALYQSLVETNSNGVEPAQAQSWETSNDGQRYTFKLKKGIAWSDGMPVIAGDFVLAFQRLIDPALDVEPRPSYLISNIKNTQKIIDGEAELSTLGVSAPDDETLVFDLERPASYFLDILSYPGLAPVPSHMIAKHGNDWWKQEPLVSNGPYEMTSHVHGDLINLRLRDEKTYPESPKKVQLRYMADVNEALRQIANKRLDIAYNLRQSDIDWIKDRVGYHKHTTIVVNTVYGIINTTKEKFKDKRVRTALRLAIDREAMAKSTFSRPAKSFPPIWMLEGVENELRDPYGNLNEQEKIAKAKALLAEAGYSGENPLKVEISTSPSQVLKQATTAMRSMFSRIGVQATLKNVLHKDFSKTLYSKQYEVAAADWVADYSDAMTFYGILNSQATKNHSAFSNKTMDALIEQALREPDQSNRRKLYAKMDNLVTDESPIVPLFHSGFTTVASPKIASAGFAPFSVLRIRDIRLNKGL